MILRGAKQWNSAVELSRSNQTGDHWAGQECNPRTWSFAAATATKWHHFPLFIFCLTRLFRVREALFTSLIEASSHPHTAHSSPAHCMHIIIIIMLVRHSHPQHAMLAQNAARDE